MTDLILEIRQRHRGTVARLLPALRGERYRRKITVVELAMQLGVSKSALSAWEPSASPRRDRRKPFLFFLEHPDRARGPVERTT
jgi:hypothetical protein